MKNEIVYNDIEKLRECVRNGKILGAFKQIEVIIDFANPNLKAVDHIEDFKMAIQNYTRNILLNQGIEISDPYVERSKMFVKLEIPTDIYDEFKACHKLKSISRFLLKMDNRDYSKYRFKNRLLDFLHLKGISKEYYFNVLHKTL